MVLKVIVFVFSLPTIHKNTGFRLRNAVEKHRHMRLCHAIWVALSCHTGCHEVGLKVIVFVHTCNVCYAVLSFFIELAITLSVICLVPRTFDENVRAKEGGKETTGKTSGRSCFQDDGKSNGGPICNF